MILKSYNLIKWATTIPTRPGLYLAEIEDDYFPNGCEKHVILVDVEDYNGTLIADSTGLETFGPLEIVSKNVKRWSTQLNFGEL